MVFLSTGASAPLPLTETLCSSPSCCTALLVPRSDSGLSLGNLPLLILFSNGWFIPPGTWSSGSVLVSLNG